MSKRKRGKDDDGDQSEDWHAMAYTYIDEILSKTDIIEDMQPSMDDIENDARFFNAFQAMKPLAFEYCEATPEVERLSELAIICALATCFIRRNGYEMTVNQWARMCSFRSEQFGLGIEYESIGLNQMLFLKSTSSVTHRVSIYDVFDHHFNASEYKFLTLRVIHPGEQVCEETRLDEDGDPDGDLIEDLRLPVNDDQSFKIQSEDYPRVTIQPDLAIVLEDRLPGWIERLGVNQNTKVVKIEMTDGAKLVLEFHHKDAFLTPYGVEGTNADEMT